MGDEPIPASTRVRQWLAARLGPAAAGAFLPFGAWGSFEVIRGNTWGLIGGPFLNWVVMMGMGTVYAGALVAAAFVVDRVWSPARALVRWRQFFALAVAAAIALPTLAVLPLNDSSPAEIALYCGGVGLLVVSVVRWAVLRQT